MRRNVDDIEALTLLPRCLRDVREIDTSLTLFGRTWRSPIGVAPMGFNGLLRPDADLALARAAFRAGIPFVQSTASNVRLERVAQEVGGSLWLQLYVMGSRQIAEQLMRRALENDFEALVLTVDVPVGGYRERDVRNAMRMPFRPNLKTVLDIASHPRWALRYVGERLPDFVNLTAPNSEALTPELAAALGNRAMDRSLVWDSLNWLREHWQKPLLLKGVLHPDDARQAIAAGVDGLIVSNHGGRQLDSAPSTIRALPAVLRAAQGKVPVLIDGGFRRGGDVAKALALGARAVLIGRPLLWGVACSGERGAVDVLQMIAGDLHRAMTLLGARNLDELSSIQVVDPLTGPPATFT